MKKITIHVKGDFGNQLFYLALAFYLEQFGYKVFLLGDSRALQYNINKHLPMFENIHFKNSIESFMSLKSEVYSKKELKGIVVRLIYLIAITLSNNFYKIVISISLYQTIKTNILIGHLHYRDLLKIKGSFDSIDFTSIRRSIHLHGYWQDITLTNMVIHKLRSSLSPSKERKMPSQFQNHQLICLHIRGGDFLNSAFFNILKVEYYNAAISIVNSKFSNPYFIVFTDDIQHSKSILSDINIDYEIVSTSNRPYYDFIYMTNFSYFILSNSTFCWWASRISNSANKIIIRPLYFNSDFIKDNLSDEKMILIDVGMQ